MEEKVAQEYDAGGVQTTNLRIVGHDDSIEDVVKMAVEFIMQRFKLSKADAMEKVFFDATQSQMARACFRWWSVMAGSLRTYYQEEQPESQPVTVLSMGELFRIVSRDDALNAPQEDRDGEECSACQ